MGKGSPKQNKVVYRHLKPCGEVFYIGIGTKNRPYSKGGRNNWWHRIVRKYGYDVEILKRNLSLEDACELEILLIDYYGRKNNGGCLVNLTDGGEGASGSKHALGYKHTKEQIEKRRYANSYKVINTETKEILYRVDAIKKYNIPESCFISKQPHYDWMRLSDYKKGRHLTDEWINRYNYDCYEKHSTSVVHVPTETVYNKISDIPNLTKSQYVGICIKVNRTNKSKKNTSDYLLIDEYNDGFHLTDEWKYRKIQISKKEHPKHKEWVKNRSKVDYKEYEFYDCKKDIVIKCNYNNAKTIIGVSINSKKTNYNKGRYILIVNGKFNKSNKWKTILDTETGHIEKYNQIHFANFIGTESNNLSSFFRGLTKVYKKRYTII